MLTEIVQITTGVRALLKLMLPEPAAAVTVPPQALVTPGVAPTCSPVGSVSVKLPLMATTLGLVMLKFTVVVPLIGLVGVPEVCCIRWGYRIVREIVAVQRLATCGT